MTPRKDDPASNATTKADVLFFKEIVTCDTGSGFSLQPVRVILLSSPSQSRKATR